MQHQIENQDRESQNKKNFPMIRDEHKILKDKINLKKENKRI